MHIERYYQLAGGIIKLLTTGKPTTAKLDMVLISVENMTKSRSIVLDWIINLMYIRVT